jgi:hypothetical protein
MRFILVIAAATAAASPVAAQDFLGALARQAATRAAERLANRAADRAAAARGGAAGGRGQAAASPTEAGAGGRPEVRVHGQIQPYDENGDLMYQSANSQTPDFQGRPYWRSAVFCAGFSRTHDIQVAKSRAEWAARGRVYDEGDPEAYRTVQRNEETRWRRFALLRLQRDQPGTDSAAMVDEQINRAEQEVRARDWSARTAWQDQARECQSFYLANSNFIMMMSNGRSR